jgi:hypothetical protein
MAETKSQPHLDLISGSLAELLGVERLKMMLPAPFLIFLIHFCRPHHSILFFDDTRADKGSSIDEVQQVNSRKREAMMNGWITRSDSPASLCRF